jgi:hypothetical protein
MRVLGFLLLVAGWIIVFAAVALLTSPGSRIAFVFSGLTVEGLGLALVIRSHPLLRGLG